MNQPIWKKNNPQIGSFPQKFGMEHFKKIELPPVKKKNLFKQETRYGSYCLGLFFIGIRGEARAIHFKLRYTKIVIPEKYATRWCERFLKMVLSWRSFRTVLQLDFLGRKCLSLILVAYWLNHLSWKTKKEWNWIISSKDWEMLLRPPQDTPNSKCTIL